MKKKSLIFIVLICQLLVFCNKPKKTDLQKESTSLENPTDEKLARNNSAQNTGIVPANSNERKVLNNEAINSTKLNAKQFEDTLYKFASGASKYWATFMNEVHKKPDPYATKEQIDTENKRLFGICNYKLEQYYDQWTPKIVTVKFACTGASRATGSKYFSWVEPDEFAAEYDPDQQCAFIGLPFINLPWGRAGYSPVELAGSKKGTKIFGLTAPVLFYSHGSDFDGPSSLVSPVIRVPLPLAIAKRIDINKAKETIEYTFSMISQKIPFPVNGYFDVSFPTIKLQSVRWIVGNDTLWYHGPANKFDYAKKADERFAAFTLWGDR